MQRIVIIVTLVSFAQAIGGLSATPAQTPRTATALRRIQVNAKTIAAVPRAKKYVVDLTQRGVKYEFDPRAGQLDFSRVTVRTARGEFAIVSFLEKRFLKDKFAGFKYASQPFSLGSLPAGTLQNTTTKAQSCHADTCSCTGDDCWFLDWARFCSEFIFCATNPITHDQVCSCIVRNPL